MYHGGGDGGSNIWLQLRSHCQKSKNKTKQTFSCSLRAKQLLQRKDLRLLWHWLFSLEWRRVGFFLIFVCNHSHDDVVLWRVIESLKVWWWNASPRQKCQQGSLSSTYLCASFTSANAVALNFYFTIKTMPNFTSILN